MKIVTPYSLATVIFKIHPLPDLSQTKLLRRFFRLGRKGGYYGKQIVR